MIRTAQDSSENDEFVPDRSYIVGREGHILLDDPSVSKQHAELRISGKRIQLKDLGSTNGTFLLIQGKLMRIRRRFIEADEPIRFGNVTCTARNLLKAIEQLTGDATEWERF